MKCLTAALFCTTALQIWSIVTAHTFTCYPNNTITISGLPTDLTGISYFAVQNTGENCTVTGNATGGTATIEDCDKDKPIYFTYSNYSDMLTNQIHGGEDVQILNITCNEISSSGVAINISNTFMANMSFAEEASINVTYDVTSELNVSSANIGDPVEWKIIFPLNYSLEITSCTAYPATAVSSHTTNNSVLLIIDWCSDVPDLITAFSTNADNTEALAVINAFKFFDKDYVFLTCDLQVCPPPGTACSTSCFKRKKRSSPAHGGEDGTYQKSVSTMLRVIDPYASSAIQWSGIGLLLTMFITTLVSFLKV